MKLVATSLITYSMCKPAVASVERITTKTHWHYLIYLGTQGESRW